MKAASTHDAMMCLPWHHRSKRSISTRSHRRHRRQLILAVTSSPITKPPLPAQGNALFDCFLLLYLLLTYYQKRMWLVVVCHGLRRHTTARRRSARAISAIVGKLVRKAPRCFYSSLLARTSGPTRMNATPKHLHRASKRAIGCLIGPFFDC